MIKINSIFKMVGVLIVTNIVILTNSCNDKPQDLDMGLLVDSCHTPYDLDSADSLKVKLKISPIDAAKYVWFKGTSGPDSFMSNYARQVGQSVDSDTVYLCWKPPNNVANPVAQYIIIGYMDADSFSSEPDYYSSNYKVLNVYRSGLSPYLVIAFSGCDRSARQNENLNDTMAFKIRARVIDSTGFGQNNKQVMFHTNKGKFAESDDNTWTTITDTCCSFPGIAKATLKLSEISNGPGGVEYDYSILARLLEQPIIGRYFNERSIIDNELSNIPLNWTHKRLAVNNPATEIPGDNLPNGSGEDPAADVKDVFVEVDYDEDLSNVPDIIEDFCISAEIALERGRLPDSASFNLSGIDVHFSVGEPIDIDNLASREEIKSKLWETKDFSKDIHVIIGHYFDDDTCMGGVSIGWSFMNMGMFYNQRMFNVGAMSSNEVIGNYRKDSMGCFIASERLNNLCQRDSIGGWYNVVGVAIAHEIGHALGLAHTQFSDGFSIMKDTLKIYKTWSFMDWGYFKLNRLYDSNPLLTHIYGLDLLNKLGVETGSLGDQAFDR
jgi:hypothetical protein